MTIWTDMPVRRGPFYLEDYQASLGLSVDAAAEQASVTNPINSIMRIRELSRAERGVGPNILDINPFGDEAPSTASEMQDATSARQRIKDEGLDLVVPDTGIRSRALDILIERKKEERKRNDILSRAPGGFVAGTARLGTGLAVSAMDPLNIASAFIPVVGEARYAAMLGRAGGALGRAGVRAGVGAAEGAAGAAVVEPIVFGAAQQEQADYGLTDSIANIAFGTVLGGGLHVGAGVVSDAVKAGRDWRTAKALADAPIPRMMESVDAKTREAVLRTGVAQAVSGREINVEPVVSYASRQGFEEPLRASVGPAEAPRIDEVTGVEGFTVFHGSPHTFDRFSMEHIGTGEGAQAYGHGLYFAQSKGVAKVYQDNLAGYKFVQDALAAGRDKRPAQVAEWLYADPHMTDDHMGQALKVLDENASSSQISQWIKDGRNLLATSRDAGATYEVRIRANPEDFLDWDKPLSEQSPKVNEALKQIVKSRDRMPSEWLGSSPGAEQTMREVGIPGIRYLDQGSRAAGDGSRNFVVFDDSLLHTIRRNDEFIAKQPQDLRATAQASFNPEQMRLYDGEAVRIADERIAAAPKDEDMPEVSLKEAMEDVTRLANALGDPEIVGREMADVDALMEVAEGYAKGVIAAADCRLRRG